MPLRMFGNMSAPANSGNWVTIQSLMPAGANAATNCLTHAQDGVFYLECQTAIILRYGTGSATFASQTAGSDYSETTLLTGRVYAFDDLLPDKAWVRSSTASSVTFSCWSA